MDTHTLCRDFAEILVFLPSPAPQLPRPLPWIRVTLRLALSLFPRASQRWLYELWFTPMRGAVRESDLRALG